MVPLQKANIRGIYLNIIKAIYEKPTASSIFNGEKLKVFPLKSEKDKCAHSPHNYSTFLWKSSPQQSEKKNKWEGIQVGKKKKKKKTESKLSLFTDDIILYIENPRDTMRILLESINEYNNIVGYKLLHRSPLFCCTWKMRKQRGK